MGWHVIWTLPLHWGHNRKPLTNERGGCWQELWGTTISKSSSPLAPPSSCLSQSSSLPSSPLPTSLRNRQKGPPLAHVWIQRWWWWWEPCWSTEKHHLQLMFGRKGGGGGSCVKTPKKTISSLHLDAREMGVMSKEWNKPPLALIWMWGRWWWWKACWNNEKKPPPACVWMRGRWCGGSCVEIVKNNHL